MDGDLRAHRFDAPVPLDPHRARRWLGGKGAALSELTRLGLPVPEGFTFGTDLWRRFEADGVLPDEFGSVLDAEIDRLEADTGLRLGDPEAPLLLAVRGGAPRSMPGMLTTVLLVGLTPEVREAISERHGRTFALDLARRFLETWGSGVLGVPRSAFEARIRARRGHPEGWDAPAVEELLTDYERLILEETGQSVPYDAREQVVQAVGGVLRSWGSTRAKQYRVAHRIPEDHGTAVVIQRMVFGNLDDESLAGVYFTRDPSTGARRPYGEYLPRAAGEDVVGGRRTPYPLAQRQVRRGLEDDSLETKDRTKFSSLLEVGARLEARFADALDVEFVFEGGQLWIVQCRSAQVTAKAAARIAVDMVEEGLLDRRAALARVEPASLGQLLTPRLPDPETLAEQGVRPLVRGLAAGPGAASGPVSLGGGEAGGVLVRPDTSAEDVAEMRGAAAIVTAVGGLTCHAAVVARSIGTPCVVGVRELWIDSRNRSVVVRRPEGDETLTEGTIVTVDGTRGLVYLGDVEQRPAAAVPEVETVLGWADDVRHGRVLAEATGPAEARLGVSFGADGIFAPAGADVPGIVAALAPGVPLYAVLEGPPDPGLLAALRPGDGAVLAGDERVGEELTDAWLADAGLAGALPEGVLRGVSLDPETPWEGDSDFVLRTGPFEAAAAPFEIGPVATAPAAAVAIRCPPRAVPRERLRAAQAAVRGDATHGDDEP